MQNEAARGTIKSRKRADRNHERDGENISSKNPDDYGIFLPS